jgi:polysaccharide transporter, PST family
MTKPSEKPQGGNLNPTGTSRDVENLDRSLVHGVAWTAGVKWASLVITWAATLIVARTLTPDDYGIVAMATVFTSLVEMLSDLGLGTAIVKHQELKARQIAQINGLCVLMGLGGWLLTCLAALPLSLFFQTPALFAVVVILGSNFLVTAFRIVPLALLQRDMQFRSAAINDGSQAILLSVAMVALALLGFRYWALVWGTVLSGFLTTLLAYRLRPMSFAWPRYREIGEAVTFGSHLIVQRFAYYVCTNADHFIAGKVLGPRALGGYSFAMTIAAIPLEKLTSLVMRVLPPIISAVQNDSAMLRRYVAGFTEGLSVMTMPAAVGLALVADDFVRLAVGDGWLVAILPLQILSISFAYRSFTPIVPAVAMMIGLSRELMRISVAFAIVLPIAFLAGTRWGIGGVAAVWLIVYPVAVVWYAYVVLRRINMAASEYLRALWPATSSTAFMAALVYTANQNLHPHWPLGLRLAAEIAMGVLAYTAFFFALHRKRLLALRDVYRLMRSKEER